MTHGVFAGVRRALAVGVLLVTMGVVGCGDADVLDAARDRGTLRVATINAPTTYYEGREGLAGYDYDLAIAFAASLGLEVEFVVLPSASAVIEAVDRGDADLGAAALVVTPERERDRRFSPAYRYVDEVVVCQRGELARAARHDLSSTSIVVGEGSNHEARLTRLQDSGVYLNWSATDRGRGFELLADVADGDVACTVADSHVYALNRRYFSGLEAVETLPGRRRVAWVLAGGHGRAGRALSDDVASWLARRETRELIAKLDEKYFGFRPEDIDARHASAFLSATDRRLEDWRELFEEAGAEHDVPWTLLAAVAYQESHWDPRAVSPTGVRGMMMLTQATARSLGVANRVDPRESTFGGAKYLRQLRNRLPDGIEGDDRWWFAAAAYNMGYGHVLDARVLARRRGLDPDLWSDVRTVLADLENPEFYGDLRHGYGNGRQARVYVRRVRDYADILEKRFNSSVFVSTQAPEGGDTIVAQQ